MITIPAKVSARLAAGVKRFQPILISARDKDVNESDTVTIISDMLSDIFGYDKYTEVTSEFAVKKTFCDLAIKLEDKPVLLIEVKAIGLSLKDNHVKQAVDYGSNSGIEWVVLTNGLQWKVFKIIFAKPVDCELIYEFDLSEINAKKQSDLELIYYLCREAMSKSSKATLDDYCNQLQTLNRYTIAQLLLSDDVLTAVRKSIKKLSPEVKFSNEEIKDIVSLEIIKRDALEGDKADEAKKMIAKFERAAAKAKAAKTKSTETGEN